MLPKRNVDKARTLPKRHTVLREEQGQDSLLRLVKRKRFLTPFFVSRLCWPNKNLNATQEFVLSIQPIISLNLK